MTQVLITVDTEISAGRQARGWSISDNVDSSIFGKCSRGAFGIVWQMTQLERHGLRGVFFVDPFPALVHGEGIVADIVGPIVARGHDVQLHCHTEWLEWATTSPVDGRRGRNIADFVIEDQVALLRYGCDVIERAGAPRPIAFRAGNFGASDVTLNALSLVGLAWDSSFNAAYSSAECCIDLPHDQTMPVYRRGVVELPVSGLYDRPGSFRPAQVCAVNSWEMRAALLHAAHRRDPVFTAVTHSFEMLSRDRKRPNGTVIGRFQSLLKTIAGDARLKTAIFAQLDDTIVVSHRERLGPNRVRTVCRLAEQAWSTLRYERRQR